MWPTRHCGEQRAAPPAATVALPASCSSSTVWRDYTIPIGSAFAVLGLIWGGLLFQAGDTRAGRVLGFVVLGVGVVLLSKPIAA